MRIPRCIKKQLKRRIARRLELAVSDVKFRRGSSAVQVWEEARRLSRTEKQRRIVAQELMRSAPLSVVME